MDSSSIQEFFLLQTELGAFTSKIDEILTGKRRGIINDKQSHYVLVNELKNEHLRLNNEISSLTDKQNKLKHNLSNNLEALQSQQSKVDDLVAKQQVLVASKQEIAGEIDGLNDNIHLLNEQITKSSDNLVVQNNQDSIEIYKFEKFLGLTIYVKSPQLIRFVFNNIDPNNIDKDVWFDLDLSNDRLKVLSSGPEIPSDTVNQLEIEFDSDKNFVKLLKLIRALLKQACLSG